MSKRNKGIFSILFVLLFVAGCGQPKISGKVVFSDDQSPLTHGVVVFHGPQHIARGEIQADGRYVVNSLTKNDGIPKGEYRISIKETQEDISQTSLPVYQNLIDQKYENPNTSELKLDVTKSQTFDIQVDRFRGKNKTNR